MQIVIGTAGLAFHGNSLRDGSLGGSETAVICMARSLAKLGHDVRVYCECRQPGSYDGVQYFHHRDFPSHVVNLDIDVLIASRWVDFLARKTKAALRVLWCHDLLVSKEQIMAGLFQTDFLFLLSDYHIENYCAQLPYLREHCVKSSNGVDLELIEANKRPKVSKKLIYTSRPERGLLNMLNMMPRILERHPDAKLYYATYKNELVKPDDPVGKLCQHADFLASQMPEHVVPLGNLKKSDLYAHISSSELFLYPTNFGEIFCIGSSEAQACGTPIVTTNNFALSEVCGPASSALIDGLPGEQEYDNRFVETVCDLLDDDDTRKRMSEAGPEWVVSQGYVWDLVAKSWEKKFREYLQTRWNNNAERIVTELYRQSDIVPAIAAAQDCGDSVLVAQLEDDKRSLQNERTLWSTKMFTEERAREEFKALLPTFEAVAEFLVARGNVPATIFEPYAYDESFGLFAAKKFPDSEVTILAANADVCARLDSLILKSGLKNVKVWSGFVGALKFDAVVSIDRIDMAEFPGNFASSLLSFLQDDGLAVFTSRSGTTNGSVQDVYPSRLWNLSIADFTSIFGSSNCDFLASFLPQSIGGGGDLVGRWIGSFRKTTEGVFGEPNIGRRKYSTRPYQKLAVCMITKNEESWLQGCLGSARTIADYIRVTDCRSDDLTANIAEVTADSVIKIDFDNFAQARNASIEGIDADWILWLDADERLLNPDNVRRYLDSVIYEGFQIRQNHLTLDQPKSFDLPVRLFRNVPNYKFTGMIHEQLEDIGSNPFDDQVQPLLVLPDVDIAHFGYLNERMRKQKCSNRNMRLLIRDVQENPERMLTWVLVMRDYINIVKWFGDQGHVVEQGSFLHDCLNACILTYHNKFANTGHRYAELSEHCYQEALRILSVSGLACFGFDTPPFEVGFTLLANVGGINDPHVSPKMRWFLCAEELKLFMAGKAEEAGQALFGNLTRERNEQFKLECSLPDPVPFLTRGCDLFAKR